MISIILPTYNRASILKNTISNVLQQSYNDIEIIIIDDSSTDNTAHVVKSFNNKKINYIKNPQRKGTIQSRLTGIKYARGDFISFLDDDDVWNNNKLEIEINNINDNVDFTLSNYIINNSINHSTKKINLKNYAHKFKLKITNAPGPFFQCCLFSKSFINKSLCHFESQYEPSEDWHYFLNICRLNPKIKYINEYLFTWNFSQTSQSANYKKEWLAIEAIVLNNKSIFLEFNNHNNLSLQFRKLGSYMFQLNYYDKFYYYYKKAFSVWPYSFKNIFYFLLLFFPKKIVNLYMKNKYIW